MVSDFVVKLVEKMMMVFKSESQLLEIIEIYKKGSLGVAFGNSTRFKAKSTSTYKA